MARRAQPGSCLPPASVQILYNWLLTLAQPSTHAGASGRHSTVGATMAQAMRDQVPLGDPGQQRLQKYAYFIKIRIKYAYFIKIRIKYAYYNIEKDSSTSTAPPPPIPASPL